jgi:hypothetical protein
VFAAALVLRSAAGVVLRRRYCALFAAVNALIRYYTRKTGAYLMLGSGLAGAALLDVYHAVVTSSFCGACSSSSLSALTPWSGMMSTFACRP